MRTLPPVTAKCCATSSGELTAAVISLAERALELPEGARPESSMAAVDEKAADDLMANG